MHLYTKKPGKNTGVGCHFLLQCRKVKSESEVAQSCLTLSDPMDCSLPGSSIHGIFQARVLEWGAIAFSEEYLLAFSKDEIPKATRKKQPITYKETCIRLSADFSTESLQPRRKWHYMFNLIKGKNL